MISVVSIPRCKPDLPDLPGSKGVPKRVSDQVEKHVTMKAMGPNLPWSFGPCTEYLFINFYTTWHITSQGFLEIHVYHVYLYIYCIYPMYIPCIYHVQIMYYVDIYIYIMCTYMYVYSVSVYVVMDITWYSHGSWWTPKILCWVAISGIKDSWNAARLLLTLANCLPCCSVVALLNPNTGFNSWFNFWCIYIYPCLHRIYHKKLLVVCFILASAQVGNS